MVRRVAPRPTRSTRGWSDADAVTLPPGSWTDAITGVERSGLVRLADLLDAFPVALLVGGAELGRVDT